MAKSSGQCHITLKQLIDNGLIDAYTTYDDTGLDIKTRLKEYDSYVIIRWNSDNGYLVKDCEFYRELNG